MNQHDIYKAGKRALSLSLWRNRLIFWIGAVIIGLIAAGFTYVADYAQKLFSGAVSHGDWLPFIICPAIFALVGWVTIRFFPSTAGSGIPQAIAARTAETPEARRYLLGPRVIFGKIALTALGLLGGASIGREGPTVQVGAALLYLSASFTRMSNEMTRSVILAGSAAGVAAAFNTPLAGIVFGIEEMARAFEHRYSSIVLTAIVFAGVASLSVLGNYSYFGYADGDYSMLRDLPAILLVGVAGGLLGGLFTWALVDGGRLMRRLCARQGLNHPVIFAALCGFVIACIGILTHGATYGTGYGQAEQMLHGHTDGAWLFTIGKFIATAISGVSGLPGGIFSPSLSVGAGLGASLAPWFPHTTLAGVVILGMTAYFAGVTQAPITAFIIVLEITGQQSLPVALIATAAMATGISRLIAPKSLYHALAEMFLHRATEATQAAQVAPDAEAEAGADMRTDTKPAA
ncbi:MAG: chloride channel protein [Rhodospirillales bacterium]|nr:chloride channel protein [Alphaproteobacteria bacterium]MCB9987223.1 chloride channel protein [Rhodospirillales bacterium]USO07915.1 MAG: chloride channel protein [Rhodospirillales bacterium]